MAPEDPREWHRWCGVPIGVTGGTSPYTCAVTSNNLPAGLSISGCVVSGTPTTAGAVVLTVLATDSSNPKLTTTGPVSLTINPAGSLTLVSPPSGTANTPYAGTIGVIGGTGPYTCTLSAGSVLLGNVPCPNIVRTLCRPQW